MIEKMSKSSNFEKTNVEITAEIKITALESEVRYWRLRYELLKKYGEIRLIGKPTVC
jgi:hypothetical protein